MQNKKKNATKNLKIQLNTVHNKNVKIVIEIRWHSSEKA